MNELGRVNRGWWKEPMNHPIIIGILSFKIWKRLIMSNYFEKGFKLKYEEWLGCIYKLPLILCP